MGIGNFEKRVMSGRPDHLFLSSDGSLFDTRDSDWSRGGPLREKFAWHFRDIESVSDLKATLRAGEYAWPGAYRLAFMASDGGRICFDCARKEFRNIADSISRGINDGWRIVACDIVDHCEYTEICDHCGAVLCEGTED